MSHLTRFDESTQLAVSMMESRTFGATVHDDVHDAVHDAFMMLPHYSSLREGETPQLGSGPLPAELLSEEARCLYQTEKRMKIRYFQAKCPRCESRTHQEEVSLHVPAASY